MSTSLLCGAPNRVALSLAHTPQAEPQNTEGSGTPKGPFHPPCGIACTRHPQLSTFRCLFTPSPFPTCSCVSPHSHHSQQRHRPCNGERRCRGQDGSGVTAGHGPRSHGNGSTTCQHHTSCRPGTRGTGGCSLAPRGARSHQSPRVTSAPGSEGHGRGERRCGAVFMPHREGNKRHL